MIKYRQMNLEMISICHFRNALASVGVQREVGCQKKLFLRSVKLRQRQSA